MSSKVDVCNQAISALGISTEIQNFDTERSKEAQACRRFYDTARQKVLRDFDWPFANAVDWLAVLANPVGLNQPTVEWGFAYRYPANALSVRRIINGLTRADNDESRAEYSVGRDSVGKIIYADLISPVQIQYTYDETDPERFPADFVDALALFMASRMAPRLTGGDPNKLGVTAYSMYRIAISEAQRNAAREEPQDQAPDADMIRVRE